MTQRIHSFRFPYFFIGIALVVAVLYRSPQGRGVPSAGAIPGDSEDRRAAISLASSALPAARSPVATTPPVVSAPSGALIGDLTTVSLPAVRKAVPEGSTPASSAAPEVPVPVKEKIYLPDSYTHALPPTPEEVHPKSVSPLKVKIVSHGNESLNQIALTFDDGPNNKYTPQILDILRQYNVKGTFFVLGEQVKEHPAMLRRIVEEGHEIGNHTFSHPQLNHLSDEKVRQELVSTQEEIRKVLGYVPKLLRPPYGAYRNDTLLLFDELGFHVVLWSVDTNDWQRKKSGDAIVRTVSRDTRNGSIILFHDRKAETVRVLPQIIEELKGRGLQPVTISELTGLPAYDNPTPIVQGGAKDGQSGS